MKTEQEILEKAFTLFLEKGFSAMSTNEIIRETGMTKGGFYYAFKGREELIQRVIETYVKPYFLHPLERMEQSWIDKKKNIETEVLLWDCFFAPQRFEEYRKHIKKAVPFRDFYLLIFDGIKNFPEVAEYSLQNINTKGEYLLRILERGKERREIKQDIDLEEYITMVLAMQDGILALKVLDDKIDDEEKYHKIEEKVWKDIGVGEGCRQYTDGGVSCAVS